MGDWRTNTDMFVQESREPNSVIAVTIHTSLFTVNCDFFVSNLTAGFISDLGFSDASETEQKKVGTVSWRPRWRGVRDWVRLNKRCRSWKLIHFFPPFWLQKVGKRLYINSLWYFPLQEKRQEWYVNTFFASICLYSVRNHGEIH